MEPGARSQSTVRVRAKRALSDALKRVRPGIALDEHGYTRSLVENLVSCVEVADFEVDVAQGGGNELARKFRAAFSSTALAVNCFAPFKRNLRELHLSGLVSFSWLRFEAKCPTGLGGTPPNLDMVIERGERVIAVESKCTEHLSPHVADFAESYLDEISDARCDTAWYCELLRLVDAPRAYRWLDAAQLIKHALGLMRTYPDRSVTLLYLFWEPLNAVDYAHFAEHRREVAAFAERVAGPALVFESMTYADLWASWDADVSRWLRAHLRELRERYGVAI